MILVETLAQALSLGHRTLPWLGLVLDRLPADASELRGGRLTGDRYAATPAERLFWPAVLRGLRDQADFRSIAAAFRR
jgi:hypothetical protein